MSKNVCIVEVCFKKSIEFSSKLSRGPQMDNKVSFTVHFTIVFILKVRCLTGVSTNIVVLSFEIGGFTEAAKSCFFTVLIKVYFA